MIPRVLHRKPQQCYRFVTVSCRLQYSTGGKSNSNLVDVWKQKLGLQWQKSQHRLHETTEKLRVYSMNIKTQWEKAQKSIQDANERLSQMENDSKDDKLNFNDEGKIKDLPSEREKHRKVWARKMELYLDSLQETIFTATRALNDVTGYSSIQKLRNMIDLLEKELKETKELVGEAKQEYETAIKARSESQKEVNELLQRKHSWSPADLDRFTQLYKDDAVNSRAEDEAKKKLTELETKEEDISTNLYRAILTRYHEEQIWSDKIRRTSTWGTFILMSVNILFFLIFQLLLEPWKRRRLVGSFEDKVKMALDDHQKGQSMAMSEMSATIDALIDGKLKEVQKISLEKPTPQSHDSPSLYQISQQLGNLICLKWHIYSQKLLNALPDISVTLSKPIFYSYSSLLLSIGFLLGFVI